jgi:predicted ribosome quality control (RQC) complex YloA/Tae2 family protein
MADAPSVDFLKKSAPARTPLVEALKSRFARGKILSARQIGADRVLEFDVSRLVAAGFEVRYFLVLEATEPVGNLLLLDEDRRIEELARHASPDVNRYRTLLPGHLYVPPPAFEGFSLPLSEADGLEFESLFQIKGIGRPLARMIGAHWEERSPREWLAALKSLYAEGNSSGEGEIAASCQRTAKGYLTRFPVTFREAEQLGEDALIAAREGVLRPMLATARARLLHELDARTGRAVKAKERRLDGFLKQLKNNADAELFRRKGQLLLANAAAVPPRAESVTLAEWNDGSEGGSGSEKNLEIALDPRLSPSRNAERYFKKYKKARCDPEKIQEEIALLKGAIEELREQRDLLDSIGDPAKFEEAARDVADWIASETEKTKKTGKKGAKKVRKEEQLPPHLRFEFEGETKYTVLVGLSARGNRYVTFKQATGDDLWLHAHEIPGAHVVVRGAKGREGLLAAARENRESESDMEDREGIREGIEEDREKILLFAASLAAAHSRAKDARSVQVDYTERRYVRSVPGPAVALVTYTNPGTIRADPKFWKEFLQVRQDRADRPRR